MSTETTPDADADADAEAARANATELAADLGDAIVELPSYRAFVEAKEAVEESEEAQAKIREFEQLREEFMLMRQTGDATNEDLRELQTAQQELHAIPEMDAYLETQSELELDLQELNEVVSEPLAVDFGDKAGGCCHD